MTQRYQDNITGRYYRACIFPAFAFSVLKNTGHLTDRVEQSAHTNDQQD